MECMELFRHVTADDSIAAHADRLVLEFVVMELTEPPAAQLTKMADDGSLSTVIAKVSMVLK
ncbi:hypothetical protein KIN20_028000 [Parelaphostrongylus tenuis]|uniref:Uncharacterized protein n=1 Tax=Parelaphostrongylus tenuis TaxID=148309 RepID=A0AAD5WEE3_PARTN|nr:hypothetical protein KIN20_028000 [Parelaphostrongylus tenuis]